MEQASKTDASLIKNAAQIIAKSQGWAEAGFLDLRSAQRLADAGLLADVERIRQAIRDGMHDDTCAVAIGSGDCDCWKDDLMRVLDGRD